MIKSGAKTTFSETPMPSLVTVTDSRLVLISAVTGKRGRATGRFLVMQLWWPWLIEVAHATRKDWKSFNTVILAAQFGSDCESHFLTLKKEADPHMIAQDIARRAWTARLLDLPLPEESQQRLAAGSPLLERAPGGNATSGIVVPGARKVAAHTAFTRTDAK